MSEEEYYNLFDLSKEKLILKIKLLQQENQQLKENNMSMQEEMARTWKKADLYKEVIEELNELLSDEFIEVLDKETIIQILNKVKGENNGK